VSSAIVHHKGTMAPWEKKLESTDHAYKKKKYHNPPFIDFFSFELWLSRYLMRPAAA
jgi:hypothetical protein